MSESRTIPQSTRKLLLGWARTVGVFGALLVALVLPAIARADSVGQIMTTKYFAPETVALIQSRAGSGSPGLRSGDIVSYIIEFTPIANTSVNGAMGYVTDYIPANTLVVGASIVQPDGSGGFVDIAPDLPGAAPDGWGSRNQRTYAAPFNVGSYTTGCSPTYTNNCNGRIAEIYADTGIFYSTDSRTALVVTPDTDGIIRQATNGYNINPTAAGQLNPIIGQTNATTHNLWDASSTNAFGTSGLPGPSGGRPVSSQGIIISTGTGATPFNAGSAVAGPDSGYKLDYTGSTGPWNRISYPGSRIGSNPGSPASSQNGAGVGSIVGSYTSAGYTLSTSNPLPSNTNAVRWAVGGLSVGQVRYVKLSLQLTADPPASGLINNCEVFGGDTATYSNKNAKDNPWRYHVPSVCTTNSNLYILKKIVAVNGTASDGAIIPATNPGPTVTYRITYANTSTVTQTNVVLTDTLPSQTTGSCITAVTVNSGPIGTLSGGFRYTPTSNPCNSPRTITFIPSSGVTLQPGEGGEIDITVQMPRTDNITGDPITNSAKICSTQTTTCANSNAVTSSASQSNLTISKSGTPSSVAPGGTVAYTLTIKNNGTATASNMVVTDILPGIGNSPCTDATRFKFISGSSTFGGSITGVTPVVTCAPTLAGFTGLNRDQVVWTFTGQTLAVNASFTITFNVTVGASVTASSTPYVNYAQVVYNAGTASTTANTRVSTPTSAELTNFSLKARAKQVQVRWSTGTEMNMVGFNIWRRKGKDTEWHQLNADLIPATNIGTVNGGNYIYKDKAVKTGKKYIYKIEIVNAIGESTWSDELAVRVKKPN